MWHARRERFDLLHVHAIGPGLLLPIARPLGFRHTVLTFHALDHQRAKWGPAARALLRLAEKVSVRCAGQVIAVSRSGTEYVRGTYHREVDYIPNGPGRLERKPPGGVLRKLGLQGDDYALFVGRLIPEKCPDDLAAAITHVPGLTAVFAGDSSFTDEYTRRLQSAAGAQARFSGYVYGSDLEELYSSALAFVLPSEVEGLSISLLEAMSFGLPVVVSDIPGNTEALGDPPAGIVFALRDRGALAEALQRLRDDPDLRRRLGSAAADRVRAVYDWDAIAEATLGVYRKAVAQ
jgi:glycosyltransferase involved in cell wall biosynthesis